MSRSQNSKTRNAEDKQAAAVPLKKMARLADGIYLKFGRSGAKLTHRVIAVALGAVVLFADYLLVLYTAVNVLPNVAVLIQQGTGVTLEMRLDAVIAGWLIPVLFIAAVVLVGEVFVMRRLWRFASGLSHKAGQALLRLDENTEKPGSAAGKVSRLNRPTKIAAAS